MSDYTLSPRARQDLKEIWQYGAANWGNSQADRYARALNRAFEVVARDPRRGRSAEQIRVGYRKFSIGAHVIFFRASADGLVIVRILHQSMDFGQHL